MSQNHNFISVSDSIAVSDSVAVSEKGFVAANIILPINQNQNNAGRFRTQKTEKSPFLFSTEVASLPNGVRSNGVRSPMDALAASMGFHKPLKLDDDNSRPIIM